MPTKTAPRRKTAYQKLVSVKFKQCAGKATATDLKKAEKAYKADAVKKGKTPAQAAAVVSKLMKRGCSIGKAKKRKASPAKRKASR